MLRPVMPTQNGIFGIFGIKRNTVHLDAIRAMQADLFECWLSDNA
jgi:hypothetical protein